MLVSVRGTFHLYEVDLDLCAGEYGQKSNVTPTEAHSSFQFQPLCLNSVADATCQR